MAIQIQPLPKWLMRRYAVLWKNFGVNPFEFDQAVTALAEDERSISAFVSKMKKSGWIEPRINPADARKRLYILRAPEEAIMNMSMDKNNIEVRVNLLSFFSDKNSAAN